MKRLWFKRKLYGWGSKAKWFAFDPISWQGWLVLLIYLTLFFANFSRIDINSHSASDILINFIPQTFVLTLILIAICYKTGEKPRWQWEKRKND